MVYVLTILVAVMSLTIAIYSGRTVIRLLAVIFTVVICLQQYFMYRSDKAKDQKLESIDNNIVELKKLTQSKPNDPPEKVLAAAAAMILELDSKTKQLESGIKDITLVRRLSDAQKKSIVDSIDSMELKRKVDLIWETDSEAFAYANDFKEVFERTGSLNFRSAINAQFDPGFNPKGLIVVVRDWKHPPQEVLGLIHAFDKAGISYTLASGNNIRNLVLIVVGFRR